MMMAAPGNAAFSRSARNPDFAFVRKIKTVRKNSQNRVLLAPKIIQRDRLTNDIRITGEAALPKRIADHDRKVAVGRVFFRAECAPENRLAAHRLKKARRH